MPRATDRRSSLSVMVSGGVSLAYLDLFKRSFLAWWLMCCFRHYRHVDVYVGKVQNSLAFLSEMTGSEMICLL